MANWKYQIDLSDIFSKLDDEGNITTGEPIQKIAMDIYQKFSKFMDAHPDMFEDDYSTEDTIDNLKYCDNVEEIDILLSELYDFCDANRIWINTWEIA
jgi:hypothetical protein